MTSTSLQTLIVTGALVVSATAYAGQTTDMPDFSAQTEVAAVRQFAIPSAFGNLHSSIIPWAASVADTSSSPDWMSQDHSSNNEIIGALVSSGVDPTLGLDLVERAKAILRRDNVQIVDVEVSTVLDPEDDYQIAQIAFLIDASFEEAIRADIGLTRALVKETRIPVHMSLIVQEAHSIQHDFV